MKFSLQYLIQFAPIGTIFFEDWDQKLNHQANEMNPERFLTIIKTAAGYICEKQKFTKYKYFQTGHLISTLQQDMYALLDRYFQIQKISSVKFFTSTDRECRYGECEVVKLTTKKICEIMIYRESMDCSIDLLYKMKRFYEKVCQYPIILILDNIGVSPFLEELEPEVKQALQDRYEQLNEEKKSHLKRIVNM